MSTIEKRAKCCIEEQLQNSIFEKILFQKIDKCIFSSIDGLVLFDGTLKDTVQKRFNLISTPFSEVYDYARYIVKLDTVMTNVLNDLTYNNCRILIGFFNLTTTRKIVPIKMSEIFRIYSEYCEKGIEPRVFGKEDSKSKCVSCFMITELEKSSHTGYEKLKVSLSCEEAKELNYEFVIYRYGQGNFSIIEKGLNTCSSRYMNTFDIFIKELEQGFRNIELDVQKIVDEIYIEYSGV